MNVRARARLLWRECVRADLCPGIPVGGPAERGPDQGLRLLQEEQRWDVQQHRRGAHVRFRLQTHGQPTDN